MEFKILKNLDTSFRSIRIYAIIFSGLCLLLCCYVCYLSYRFAEVQREKIYVLDQGKSLMLALSQDAASNRPVEAREHVRRFHELFFTLAPEKQAIESNIRRALVLADKSVYEYYNDLSEDRYYNRMISTNTNQTIQIDSIVGDFDHYPYQMMTYARQYIYRKSNVTERSLVTSCNLITTVRSDANPQGFMIEDFRVLVNNDIKRDER